MDQFDYAQDIEMNARNAAIEAQRGKVSTISTTHCVDCGEAIPQERQAIGGVCRCIECQQYVERKAKINGR